MKSTLTKLIGIAGLLLGLMAGSAFATTTANSVITAQTPNRILANFGATASCTGSAAPYTCCTGSAAGCVAGTNYTLYTAGANGSKCTSIWTNNSENATHLLTFQLVNASVLLKGPGTALTTVVTGANGTFGIAQPVTSATNWPGLPVDSDGNPYLSLNSGDSIVANFATAITAGDVITFGGTCADF